MTKSSIEKFDRDIMDLLNEYGEQVFSVLEDSIKQETENVEKQLHSAGTFKGTKFKKGWKSKVENNGRGIDAVVYNAKAPQLTHLLEFGHAKQNGGRTKAFNFIAPINDKVENDLAKIIERKLQK